MSWMKQVLNCYLYSLVQIRSHSILLLRIFSIHWDSYQNDYHLGVDFFQGKLTNLLELLFLTVLALPKASRRGFDSKMTSFTLCTDKHSRTSLHAVSCDLIILFEKGQKISVHLHNKIKNVNPFWNIHSKLMMKPWSKQY